MRALLATIFLCLAVPSHAADMASFYHEGRLTASGERFNPDGLTAAHRWLPFGSMVTVTNKRNGQSVTVRINDRGPFIAGRKIDLSRGAARQIGMLNAGVAPVDIAVQSFGPSRCQYKHGKGSRWRACTPDHAMPRVGQ